MIIKSDTSSSSNSRLSPEIQESDRIAASLLKKIAGGDRQSFDEFTERYEGVIYATALKVLRHPEDARDVTQDVLVKIWDKAATYSRGKGRPLTWVATMTRNRAIDRMRTFQCQSRLQDRLEGEAKTEVPREQESAADDVCREEEGAMIRSAVMRLSREQREVIEMAYFAGLTQSEIADSIGAPLGTVKARIRRGVQRLRTLLSPKLSFAAAAI